MKRYTPLLVLVLLSGCALNGDGAPTAKVPGDFFIEMTQTPCFGTCPVYTARIEADGTLEYHGERFVAAEGARTGQVDADDVALLWERVNSAAFFDLDAAYDFDNPACGPTIMDMPVVVLRVRADGREHEVLRDDACALRPAGWTTLVRTVEQLPQVQAWVGERR
jgi:hypothetical protein